jgi:LysR family hydrogen peroxide-inducible transcriptional activator
MAATGSGIAVLPSIYTATEARRETDARLHEIADLAASRNVSLIQPKLPEPRPGNEVLADILQSEAQKILGSDWR